MTSQLREGKEYASFYKVYIQRSGGLDVSRGLRIDGDMVLEVLRAIPEEMIESTYAAGKWTLRQVIQHISDTERIFAYRACAIARGETQAIPGYDQDIYADAQLRPSLGLQEMVDEFDFLRKASILLFRGFDDKTMKRIGEVSNGPMSVRAIGYIMIGHALHHVDVIQERYLPLWNSVPSND